ncbi:hypothetical protein GALMADRAFT_140495 [Galerina marginata CBS 339.88]|uniref:HhH-GPD domain-containing protein n=1 Tax=Galerina marginata (strain CBS 339.88) TaxID=685588 RepID=A0A067SYA4_GALM3|nr:hypothetical protein GALMADRAFT_140495 [Galerina marginata CBS 339.88]
MPAIRRSSTRLANANAATANADQGQNTDPDVQVKTKTTRNHKVDPTYATEVKKSSKPMIDINAQASASSAISSGIADDSEAESFVPAVLSFDFEDAKKCLIEVDQRFDDLFSKMTCKPFQQLEQVHPFRALATSILGQQISWLAARSILHRFLRLYDPSLPEKPDDEQRKAITFFPTPGQVANTDIAVLRTAGLSGRKAEYVQDLAARFADGRLSTQKLLEADDEELAKMLIEVRGIGRWTVDMFAIFSLRRPDILPVGDLGVQRGLVRWFLSLHSPVHSYSLSPEKVGGTATPKPKKKGKASGEKAEEPASLEGVRQDGEEADTSSVVPATSRGTEDMPSIPPAFTPSIKKTLNKVGGTTIPLPSGVDIPLLQGRLNGKKIKGAFLTPQEMEALTECWKPYRSLGVYYMWSLAE